MSLLNPIKTNIANRFRAAIPVNFRYKDPLTGIEMTRKFSSLFIGAEDMTEAHKWYNLTVHTNIPSPKQVEEFISMQTLIKICAENAEDIKDRFLRIVLTVSSAINENRIEIMKMDFMKLKDVFMDYLKRDSLIKTIDAYSSNQKLKPFRKDLNTFILNRNIYTHGQLHFQQPNLNYIIEYIDNQTKELAYALIEKEILISYNEFYSEILKLIQAFHSTRER